MKKAKTILIPAFLLSLVLLNNKAMANVKNLVGNTYVYLTVISYSHYSKIKSGHIWTCRCQCGREVLASTGYLNSIIKLGLKGCNKCSVKSKTHGMTLSKEWRSWRSMRGRCMNTNDPDHFRWYSSRGISVCERWDSFENFLADMGPKPTPKHTIDRIDPNGNYEPSNCRWATQKEQHNNKRSNHWIEFRGERKTIQQWLDIVGMADTTFHSRLKRGMSVADALTTPVKKYKKIA